MGNRERNTYVMERITRATLCLLEDHELSDISVSQICQTAQVSRNSFYRNFESREDVLARHISALLESWSEAYQGRATGSNAEMYGSLFAFLKKNAGLLLLLKRRGLFHLFERAFMENWGPKAELENVAAYTVAFVSYGTYGWIEEWIARGMHGSHGSRGSHGQESAPLTSPTTTELRTAEPARKTNWAFLSEKPSRA